MGILQGFFCTNALREKIYRCSLFVAQSSLVDPSVALRSVEATTLVSIRTGCTGLLKKMVLITGICAFAGLFPLGTAFAERKPSTKLDRQRAFC
jgi:hypothetical protein